MTKPTPPDPDTGVAGDVTVGAGHNQPHLPDTHLDQQGVSGRSVLDGTITAVEPDTEPVHPLRADDVQPLIPKEIG